MEEIIQFVEITHCGRMTGKNGNHAFDGGFYRSFSDGSFEFYCPAFGIWISRNDN